jgi:hypothetical protein
MSGRMFHGHEDEGEGYVYTEDYMRHHLQDLSLTMPLI